MYLSNEQYLAQLDEHLQQLQGKGASSLYFSQKKNPVPNDEQDSKPSLLLRVKNGANWKISTIVDAKDFTEFFARYTEVCKGGMIGLKKRDRKKNKNKKKKKAPSAPNA
ncbi:signal recognition particle subunit Srp14 [Schizosaccharomyces cryophilus OY26]|uniref:Signal recognition particle subunit SRP14 n=1 Tax=Schizosaccharomyces cryophilus (strain OY26 / ATCC MYA-4695 / CBS 11777 / NBRC 106824 / NRRL Y48691) TaxID=653667 RepID=S9XFP0_SCHCR|nr:signal recognition particle subunit Srp14 [Schizosaccharomyces cryophilus OY26]EPY52456.1 signal recognition particle subunit Srp14 [Schizosaccharomyces cryophilus OY26]